MSSNLSSLSVWSANENMYMRCLWSAKCMNVHARLFLRVRIFMPESTHAHASIMSLWSLQSNSFRQKSLKQPRFLGFTLSPFCLLSPQQPPTTAAAKNNTGAPLEPAPHHSTAWPQERDQNTHKKGNTSYCGRRGKKEHSYSSMLEDIYWWFWQARNHTY